MVLDAPMLHALRHEAHLGQRVHVPDIVASDELVYVPMQVLVTHVVVREMVRKTGQFVEAVLGVGLGSIRPPLSVVYVAGQRLSRPCPIFFR